MKTYESLIIDIQEFFLHLRTIHYNTKASVYNYGKVPLHLQPVL